MVLDDLEKNFLKLANPRMSAGLIILHILLSNLKGEPIEPKEVRKTVDKSDSSRQVSKQSITNAAGRLEGASVIDRKENKYVVNYGYLISLLLNTVLELNKRIITLQEEVDAIKTTKP